MRFHKGFPQCTWAPSINYVSSMMVMGPPIIFFTTKCHLGIIHILRTKEHFQAPYVNKRKLRLWMDPCQTDNCQGPPFADNHFKQCNSTVAKIAAVFTMLLYQSLCELRIVGHLFLKILYTSQYQTQSFEISQKTHVSTTFCDLKTKKIILVQSFSRSLRPLEENDGSKIGNLGLIFA